MSTQYIESLHTKREETKVKELIAVYLVPLNFKIAPFSLLCFKKNRKIAIILMIFNMLFMLLFTSGYMFYCERMRGSRPLNGTCYFWEMYLQAKVTFYK